MNYQDQNDRNFKETTVYVNGQEVHVVYKPVGDDVEIVRANKNTQQEAPSQEETNDLKGEQTESQGKEAKGTLPDITAEEMEIIREKVKEEHKQEKATETQEYKSVEELADRVHYADKVADHVAGTGRRKTNINEFKDARLGPVQGVETQGDYREHLIKTAESQETKCFIGQNGSDKGALFFYNRPVAKVLLNLR